MGSPLFHWVSFSLYRIIRAAETVQNSNKTKIVTYSRAVVIHSGQDDLGLGGTPLSNTTGNSGARVACGVIGTCK